MAELGAYLDALVRAKQSDPGDGLIDELLAHQVPSGTIDRDEVVGLALVLLIAGHATTSTMISMGTLALLEHPAQLAAVRSGEATLPGVVEELLRYVSSEGALPRALFTRIPSLSLAVSADELTTTRGSGLNTLPVRW